MKKARAHSASGNLRIPINKNVWDYCVSNINGPDNVNVTFDIKLITRLNHSLCFAK